MDLNVWFWGFMAVWLLFGAWPAAFPGEGKPRNWPALGGTVLMFICVAILGYAEFGSAVKGHG
jgi:hypothetical protein